MLAEDHGAHGWGVLGVVFWGRVAHRVRVCGQDRAGVGRGVWGVRTRCGRHIRYSDIPVAQASFAKRDMSVVKQDIPAGMELNAAYIHGSRACACEGNLLHVLRLMPILKAASHS